MKVKIENWSDTTYGHGFKEFRVMTLKPFGAWKCRGVFFDYKTARTFAKLIRSGDIK